VARRNSECLRKWNNQNDRYCLRDIIFKVLVDDMEWPKPLFLPDDPCSILFFDPTIDVKSGTALSKIESIIGKKLDPSQIEQLTLGDLFRMAIERQSSSN